MPLHLPKGRVFRLAFGPSIKKGDWYIGVKCHECGKPILVLEDAAQGQYPPDFTGEGKLSIPCRSCEGDDVYEGSEVTNFRATFSSRSFRDERPEPSGSPRQPLLPKHGKARVTFGIGALEQRPDAAKIIARCIAYWTAVESNTANLLATILKANSEPAVAVYLSLQNNRAKRDVMFAAAEATLTPPDLRLFQAVMAYREAIEKERNALAHGVFGISNTIKTGVVWVDTATDARHRALVGLHGATEELQEAQRKKCFVYEVGDLETIAREIENLETQIGFLSGYLSASDPTFRAIRYPQLCSEPRIRRELDRMDKKKEGGNGE